jgi:hypothetical protein
LTFVHWQIIDLVVIVFLFINATSHRNFPASTESPHAGYGPRDEESLHRPSTN